MHISWLQVTNQRLDIFYSGVQLKPYLETLNLLLGAAEHLKYINPLQTKVMKRCAV